MTGRRCRAYADDRTDGLRGPCKRPATRFYLSGDMKRVKIRCELHAFDTSRGTALEISAEELAAFEVHSS